MSLDYLTGRTDEKAAEETPDMNARVEQLEKMVAKLTEMQSGANE